MKKIYGAFAFLFSTSQKESRGAVVLLLLMVMAIAIPLLHRSYSNSPLSGEEISHLELEYEQLDNIEKKKREVIYFEFDPNQVSVTQLKSLGLPAYVSERIVKYRNTGARFKYKEDLLKIYGFKEEWLEPLKDYIVISKASRLPVKLSLPNTTFETQVIEPVLPIEQSTVQFDVNSTDTSLWRKINGIGPVLSERIVKYRNKLGGFYAFEQLHEVYGLDSEVVMKAVKQLTLTDVVLEKINISSASFKEINAHPYLSYEQTKLILNYRRKHGGFNLLNDLVRERMLSPEEFDRILPYLEIEQ